MASDIWTFEASQIGDSGAIKKNIEEDRAGSVQSAIKTRQDDILKALGKITYAR